ncbi:2-dehydro-3-deoxygluconokinase [Limihaloglobus sulfuriphilus]|uniref:2-dehydro-3-deoxygluconokinase n=1 Tax=Limihaloglobus sulfuriphilus TaxID=1851148 RepID=A0A1Q2MBY3_9BACT|nr:sugar kinase [Limihaloglobus sulfuriphilus]AQQ69787.1 2-dehydro-3-deoxygluconokinase [Limihaloglobus sulfuriphilus]
MKKVVTFGEIMGRISPAGFLRFRQALPGTMTMSFAGAEANVAASIAYMGGSASFVTSLPRNDITDACLAQLRAIGVDTSGVVVNNAGRLGLYYTENGSNQRPSRVIYDRAYSAISLTEPSQYDWESVFEGAGWFHVTGITPSLSKLAAEAAVYSVKKAKEKGLSVSCDLNFRSKLWRWDPSMSPAELARCTMESLLAYVDVLIANEEDASSVLGIQPANTDINSGRIDAQEYKQTAAQIAGMFPNITKIATTLRQNISASHNNWGAMLYDCTEKDSYYAPLKDGRYSPYSITHIVDRVGGGDSFAAALIYALNTEKAADLQEVLDYAAAASCLAHTISGDYNFNTREEIETLAAGNAAGRVVR